MGMTCRTCTTAYLEGFIFFFLYNPFIPEFVMWSLPSLKSLRKHAYSNILKILQPKKENFQIKNSNIFHISAQNIYCGYTSEPPRRGGSNENPQSMFFLQNKKNNVYPYKPQFYYIKLGFKGVKIIYACFRDVEHVNWCKLGFQSIMEN